MNTDRMDDILDQQSGRSLLDSTGPSGSMDLLNPAFFGKISRSILGSGSGTKRKTPDLVKEGLEAQPEGEVLTPDQAEELTQAADTLNVTPPTEAPPSNPGDMPPSVDPDQYAADVAAREDLERRTWERNINLDYVERPEDIGAILEVNADQIPTAARESLGEIEVDASKVDMSEVFNGPPNGALNSRQLLAGRQMLVTMVSQLQELTNKVLDGSASTEDKANFDKLQRQSVMLQKFMQGKIRETGRALNSMKIVARAVNSRDIEAIAGVNSTQATEMQAKILNDMFSEDGNIVDVLGAVDKMGPINKRIGALANYWTASILSGPTTQAVNVLSNATFQMVDTLAIKPVAAGISPLRRKITGDPEGTEAAEVAAEIIASKHGFRDALLMAGRVFKEGAIDNQGEYVSSFGGRKVDEITREEMKMSEVMMINKIPVLSHLTNMAQRGVEAASYGGLTMGDEFFKAMAYRKSLYAQVVRQAKMEGLTGEAAGDRANDLLNNITHEMNGLALKEAERLTFTNETGGLLGMISQSVVKWTMAVPALRFVAPFIKTPVALLDRTIKMSPLAPLQEEFRQQVAKGGPDADVALAQMTFGTSVFAMAALMYHENTLTGSGPKDHAQRAALDRLGWQANSIKVGGKWVSYGRGLDPLGMSVGAVANMLDVLSYAHEEADAMDYTAGTIFAIAKYFKDTTYMQGFAEIMAVVDGNRSPTKYFSRQLGSFVPSLLRDAEKIRRGSEVGPGVIYPGASFWETFNGYLEQRLPGNVGDDLPPRRYWDGTIVTAGGGEATYIYNTLSPIKINTSREDLASDRMVANGVKVRPPSSSLTLVDGMRVKLDLMDLQNGGQLYDRLLQITGEQRRRYMDRLVEHKSFKKLDSGPKSDQALKIEEMLLKAGKVAKSMFLKELMDKPPSVEKHGPDAALLDKRQLKRLLKKLKNDDLNPDETETMRKSGARGVSTREEIYVPN